MNAIARKTVKEGATPNLLRVDVLTLQNIVFF